MIYASRNESVERKEITWFKIKSILATGSAKIHTDAGCARGERLSKGS